MGTATVQFIDETGAVLYPEEGGGLFGFLIDPGESRQLIVKVTNARSDGSTAPVVHEKVTFTLLTPQNGGRVTMVKEYTDSSGRAVGMYTAGNNFEIDNVRATTDAGASAECSVYKTGGLVGSQIASLTTDGTPSTADGSYSVSDGQTRIVTAQVTDGLGNPKQNVAVTFTLATNDSGGCFIDSSGACVSSVVANSDISGTAQATYRAGSQWSTAEHYDTVRATLSNGSTRSIVFRRSAGEGGAQLALSANPAAVSMGSTTTITATVTGGDTSGVGEYVTLSISLNSSGGSFINSSGDYVYSVTLTTGSSGTATVIYQPGSNSPDSAVEDLIQGVVYSSGLSGAVTVTRNSESGGGGGSTSRNYVDDIDAVPSTLHAGETSTITADLLTTSEEDAIDTITFTFMQKGSGSPIFLETGNDTVTRNVNISTGLIWTSVAVSYKAGTNTGQDVVKATLGSGDYKPVTITVE